MTVMAPEAAEQLAALRARGRQIAPRVNPASGRIQRPAPRARVTPARPAGQRFRGSQRVSAAPAAPARVTGAARARDRAATRRVARGLPTAKVPRGNYQAIVLAEFVAAVVLVAAAPVVKSKKDDTTGIGQLSPYTGQHMIQFAAITLTYFLLALLSVGGRGPARLAAWFGGLILLTVGLAEASSIAQTLDLFGLGGAPAGTGSSAGTGAGGSKKLCRTSKTFSTGSTTSTAATNTHRISCGPSPRTGRTCAPSNTCAAR